MKKGINSNDVKNRNRGLVLKLILSKHFSSRTEITNQIHLSKMTVTNIVNELITEGYVAERDITENNNVGRNPITLDMGDNAPQVMGIYLSRDYVRVILTNLEAQVLFTKSITLKEENKESISQKLIYLINEANGNATHKLLGIGVSAIGPLDSDTGIILNPTNFFNITNFPIKKIIEDRFHLPVFLNNDMNASALAEQLFGLGKGFGNFIYIGITNGIGAGIVSNGKLYQDNSGFVGEIGHMGINFNGEVCSCGNRGCLELYANIPVIYEKLKKASGKKNLTYDEFEELSNNSNCNAVFEDVISKLSYALINVSNILDPEVIIMGHQAVYIPEKYIFLLQQNINQGILSSGHKKIKIQKSSFGDKSPLIGSACCILEQLFSGKIF